MASIATKFTVRHLDTTGKNKNSESFICDQNKISVNIDSDTATQLDTFARAIVALSKDTYTDSEIQQTVSLSEIITE